MKPYKRLNFWALSISVFLILFGILVHASSTVKISQDDLPSDGDPRFLIVQGSAISSLSNPANPPAKIVKTVPVIVTAYSSTPEQTDSNPFITASGDYVRQGIVANNLLPFGTKIRIPEIYGDEVLTVEDRMNSKKGYYHVDIWMPDYNSALAFGAKKANMEILE